MSKVGRGLFVFGLLAITAQQGQAEGTRIWHFTVDGEASLGLVEGAPPRDRYLFGDVMLNEDAGAFASSAEGGVFFFGDLDARAKIGDLTLDAGVFGFLGRHHETYATVGWSFGTTDVSLGVPRPAYDRTVLPNAVAAIPAVSLNQAGFGRSHATTGALFDDQFLPWGASVATAWNDAVVGLSFHSAGDLTVTGFSVARETSTWQAGAAVELVEGSSLSEVNAKLGLSFGLGENWYGVSLFRPASRGSPEVLEAWARFRLGERAEISLVHDAPLGGGEAGLTGVTAGYWLGNSYRLEGSIAAYGGSRVFAGARIVREF